MQIGKEEIINCLKDKLESLEEVHAFWIEGSLAQGHADEFSDIDLWFSVDDDRVFSVFEDIEKVLSEVSKINFKYVVKDKGGLGQRNYHLENTSEFLSIDVNTQGASREIFLTRGIDDAEIIFDKKGIVKFKEREMPTFDMDLKRKKLQDFYKQMLPSLVKNIKRDKKLEALYYYHLILQYATKFLRLKYGWHEKIEYDLKHIYRDIPASEVERLESFYGVSLVDIESKLPAVEKWIMGL